MNKKKLEEAKEALKQEGITFAAVSQDGVLRTSEKKGIAPIMELLQSEPDFLVQAAVADRVIGRAAALLLVKAGIESLFAAVVSEHAVKALETNGIAFTYGKRVPYIINRKGDGMCPMEATVLEEENPETAYCMLKKKIAEMAGR